MLRQHIADMYQAWMTWKAPPPPPPSFLDAPLTQTTIIVLDDPPYSPDPPAYHNFPNHLSSSITHSPITSPQNCPPVISTIPMITTSQQSSLHKSDNEHPLKAHDAQYYPSDVAHKVPDSYNQSLWNEPHVENEKFTGKEGRDELSRKLKGSKTSKLNLYDGRGDPVAHLRG